MNAEFTDLKLFKSTSEKAFSIGFGSLSISFGEAGSIVISFSIQQSTSGSIYVTWPNYKKKGTHEKGKQYSYYYLPTGQIKLDLEKYIVEEFSKIIGVPEPKKKVIPIGQSQGADQGSEPYTPEPPKKTPLINWKRS